MYNKSCYVVTLYLLTKHLKLLIKFNKKIVSYCKSMSNKRKRLVFIINMMIIRNSKNLSTAPKVSSSELRTLPELKRQHQAIPLAFLTRLQCSFVV